MFDASSLARKMTALATSSRVLIRRDGTRELLAFTRAKSESQAGWEGLLNDLFQRGLRGKNLQMVITDGCPGLARALETVYPRALHQRCWVHKMRNILEKVRRRDEAEGKSIFASEPLGNGLRDVADE